jgi:hypothetical protein
MYNKPKLKKQASMTAALIGTNALIRHGHSVPLMKRVLHRAGKAVIHAGYQSGVRGEKGPHRVTRELIGTIKDPYHTGLFEKAREMGQEVRGHKDSISKKVTNIKQNSRAVKAYDRYKPVKKKEPFDVKKEHYEALKSKFPHVAEHIDSALGTNFDGKNDKLQQRLNHGARWLTKDTTFGRFKNDVTSAAKKQMHRLHSDESTSRKPIHRPLTHVERMAWEDTKELGLNAGEALGGKKARDVLNTDVRTLGRGLVDKIKNRKSQAQISNQKKSSLLNCLN